MTNTRAFLVFVVLITLCGVKVALATAQEHEILWVRGERFTIISNPLAPWIQQNPDAIPSFGIISTGRWRQYLGEWEIEAEKLKLKDIWVLKSVEGTEHLKTEDVSVIDDVFPGGGSVEATWYSGYLIVAKGHLKRYRHMGYASSFSKYLVFEVERGAVVSETKMRHARFEAFRRSQFRKYRGTADFRTLLESTIDEDTTEKEAVDFIFEVASVHYLSANLHEEVGTGERECCGSD